MKSKQQEQTKYPGKKKFGRFFRRRLLICTVAALGLIGWKYLYKGWEECRDSTLPGLHEYRVDGVEHALARIENTEEDVSLTLGKMLYPNPVSEQALLLYQPETGECYPSKTFAAAYTKQGGESKFYYLYDPTLVGQLADSINKQAYYTEAIVHSIYVKNDMFLPGEVYMQKDRVPLCDLIGVFASKKPIPGEWADLTIDRAEGWDMICNLDDKETLSHYPDYENETDIDAQFAALAKDEPKLGYVFLRGSPNSPTADACMQEVTQQISENFEQLQKDWAQQLHDAEYGVFNQDIREEYQVKTREELIKQVKESIESQKNNLPQSFFTYFLFGRDEINRPYISFLPCDRDITFRGQNWQLWYFQYYYPERDFKYNYVSLLPLRLAFSVIPVLLLALVWAVISYLIYSRRYDIETYRRNLTGALAHDLKTPLAVIYGNAENIRAHNHPENTDEYADFIMENVTHMDEMIAGVLGLAQLEARKRPKLKDRVDVTALLHAAFRRNAAVMEQRGLTLKESGTFIVEGNADMLLQLAENLAANAVQHAAEGSEITVSAEKCRLRICNPYTGELDEKTLCEPFRRGDAERSSHSGSGLGLSIVQQIAALNKIRLRITARDGVFTAELKRNPLRRTIKIKKERPKKKERLDLTALLHTAFRNNAAAMETNGLTLSESGRCMLTANAERLSALAAQLAETAVRHAAAGSRITVTGEKYALRIRTPYTGTLDETALLKNELSTAQQTASLYQCKLRVTAEAGILTTELKLNPLFQPIGKH